MSFPGRHACATATGLAVAPHDKLAVVGYSSGCESSGPGGRPDRGAIAVYRR
jgi:hypothetical protein